MNNDLEPQSKKRNVASFTLASEKNETQLVRFSDCLNCSIERTLSGKPQIYSFGRVVGFDARTWLDKNQRFFSDVASIDDYYFAVTPTVKKYAADFLNEFHSSLQNLTLIDHLHIIKLREQGKRSAFSQCASFVHCKIDEQTICYIALSYGNSELSIKMKEIATQLSNQNKDVQYVVISQNNDSYRYLLEDICPKLNLSFSNRRCAEKFYIPLLIKLLSENPLCYIEGVVNCSIRPYEYKKSYGKLAPVDSIEYCYLPNPTMRQSAINLNKKGYFVSSMPCCPNCKKIKPAVLTLLNAAYLFGQKNKEQKDNILSPLHKSFL